MAGTHVIYLVWPPMGPEPLERFAASYRRHPAGREHRLVLLFKGVQDDEFASRARVVAGELQAEVLDLPAVGLDLDTYLAAARSLEAESICMVNSSSEILADNWLAALANAVERTEVGMAGASASYESALSAAPRPLRPLLRSRFPRFPNPHVRTNAFMLRRALMLTLDWRATTRKRAALELESGRLGLTRQIVERGLKPVVVGRGGECYDIERWPESHTFRSGTQENLLIADNRTRQYEEADPGRRAELARYAWGDRAPVSRARPASMRPA